MPKTRMLLALALAAGVACAGEQREQPSFQRVIQSALEKLGLVKPRVILTPAQFAEKLYPISVYTGEREALGRLLAAEVDLLASRLLAQRVAGARGALPARAPASWDAMLARMRNEIEPIAKRHFEDREPAMRRAGFDERTLYVQAYAQLVSRGKNRNVQFADGTTASSSDDQIEDIPQILEFHERSAAPKWRSLWPELRAYAAKLASLEHRIEADPGLGPDPQREKRAAILAARIGGRTVSFKEWMSMSEGRLGLTLSGMYRFDYPLGTVLISASNAPSMTIREGRSASVVITSQSGGFVYSILDANWDADLSRRLSRWELQQIEEALTAEYDKKKGRWFAPLEIEWDAHLQVTKQIQANGEMRALYRRFADEAAFAADRLWGSWE